MAELTFTQFYSHEHIAKVNVINAELEQLDSTPLQIGFEFVAPVPRILQGKFLGDPSKPLNRAWEVMFGDAKPEDIECNGGVSESYSVADRKLLRTIRLRLRAKVIRDHQINNASLAKQLNVSATAISQVLNGRYPASPTNTLNAIWAMIDPVNYCNALDDNLPDLSYGNVPFFETEFAKLVFAITEQARKQRRIAVLSGSPGIGKSMALRKYAEREHTILLDGSVLTGVREILEELCCALDIPTRARNSQMMKEIIQRLRDGNAWVIVLDEADKVRKDALEPLRTISDNAFLGVALVGNKELTDLIQTEDRYKLIRNRICARPKPRGSLSVEDIKTLYRHCSQNKLNLADETDSFFEWLNRRVNGSARSLVENLLPHLLKWQSLNKDKAVDQTRINLIMQTVLDEAPTYGE